MTITVLLPDVETDALKDHIDTLANLTLTKSASLTSSEQSAIEDATAIFSTIINQANGASLVVRKTIVMGIEKFYPENELARSFLFIMGEGKKQVFSKESLREIKKLGYHIELAVEELNLETTEKEQQQREKLMKALKARKPRKSGVTSINKEQEHPQQQQQQPQQQHAGFSSRLKPRFFPAPAAATGAQQK